MQSKQEWFNHFSLCIVICYDFVSPFPCLGIKAFSLGYYLLGHLFLGSILNHSMCSRDEECFSMFSNCNAKWRVCCTHLYTKPTITSSVYGRQFSIINNYVLNLTTSYLGFFTNCGMQYVGQSGRSLKTIFHEFFIKMKMPKN